MSNPLKRYYQEIHFKMNELMLYYNFEVISEEVEKSEECPHVDKLRCSRSAELAPNKCITQRKCEIYFNRDILFTEVGINVKALQELDYKLRKNK